MLMLSVAVIVLILGNTLALAGALIITKRYAEGRFRSAVDLATTELEKLAKGEPCQSAAILNAIGQLIGSEAGRSAKASLMADLAHGKRNLNAAEDEAAGAALTEGSPALGALLSGMSGGRKNKLLSNPLVQLAMAGLGRGHGNGSATSSKPPKSFSL